LALLSVNGLDAIQGNNVKAKIISL
jgi:hypothetical protein